MILLQIKSLLNFFFLPAIKKKFVFYSESFFYKNFYYDLFLEIKKKEKNCIIVTSDVKEYFFWSKKNIQCFYLNNKIFKYIFFQYLDCQNIIMTMTDIGNNYKKSNNCKNYIYFFHSLASTHQIYTERAFNNYDIIFVNGEYQIKEIRLNEKINKLKKKNLIKTGYFFLKFLKKNLNKNNSKNKTILFAPSWNYNKLNLFNDYGLRIIQNLIACKYRVILRPHPEILKRNFLVLKKIEKIFKNEKNFFLDLSESNLESMEKSKIIITDNSTIGMEYAIVLKRPVLYLNYTKKIHNKNFENLKLNTLEDIFKKRIGFSLDVKNLDNLDTVLKTLKVDKKLLKKINFFEQSFFYESKSSIKIAAKYLIRNNKNLN